MTARLAVHFNPSTLDSARRWYTTARSAARRLSRTYRVTLRRAAGMIAALSPRCAWSRNVAAAEDVMRDGSTTRALGANVDKARRILAGEAPLSVLSGPKVRAFYRAIIGDNDAVVVDSWIARAAGWKRTLTPTAYARISRALRTLAAELSIAPSTLQAAIWIGIRGSAD